MYIACKLAKKYPHLSDGLMSLANNIANTRVQAGVHYPSDVEAGKVIGRFLAEQ
jgi:membrane-associated phospholipid phosphatase